MERNFETVMIEQCAPVLAGLLEVLHERADHPVLREAVAPGVREHRDAVLVADETDGFGHFGPVDLDAAGAPGFEVLVEGVLIGLDVTVFVKPVRKVRAREVVLVAGQGERAFVGAVNPHRVELLGDEAPAAVTLQAHVAEEFVDAGVFGVEPQPHDVDRAAAPARRNLHPRDEAHAERVRLAVRGVDAVHRVVVGEAHQRDAVGVRQAHEFGGRERTVGDVGMGVKVDDHGDSLLRPVRSVHPIRPGDFDESSTQAAGPFPRTTAFSGAPTLLLRVFTWLTLAFFPVRM